MKVRTIVSKKTGRPSSGTSQGRESKAFDMRESEYRELTEAYQGICLGCGEVRDECEPDATRYPCEVCGEPRVYGAEWLLVSGRINLVEEDS